jgi:hypothetical protein
MRFKFVSKSDDMLYNPKRELTSFYQICKFSCGNDFYTVRKIIIDELGDVTSMKEKNYKKKKLDKFMNSIQSNKYSLYSTHDMKLINPPEPGNILASKSSLINNNNDHSGFAGF